MKLFGGGREGEACGRGVGAPEEGGAGRGGEGEEARGMWRELLCAVWYHDIQRILMEHHAEYTLEKEVFVCRKIRGK